MNDRPESFPARGDDAAGANPARARAADRAAGLSDHARNLLQRVATALQTRRLDDADRALAALDALAGDAHPEVLRLRAVAQHLRGRYDDAASTLRRALEQRPDDALLHNNLGSALGEAGEVEGSLEALRRATELAPRLAASWFNFGRALGRHGRIDAALDAHRRALACDDNHLAARINLGQELQMTGRIGEAQATYRDAIERHPDSAAAWFVLSTIRTLRFDAADTQRLEDVLRRSATDADRVFAGFALAKAYEDVERYSEAFAILGVCNATHRRGLTWDAASFSRYIAGIRAAFARPPQPPADPSRGREIIFIVGMPRSGSTLTEQILAAHPEVEGGNELDDLQIVINEESRRRRRDFPAWAAQADDACWERLGNRYLERTARWRERSPVSTDKSLANWRYLGAAMAMLPGARFVDCRRDPLETCLSCFRHLFAKEQAYTCDLGELAAFWHEYDALMRHWQSVYPGRIHTFRHERLLDDPDAETRALLDACGLPFDDACLRPHEVERSVRTASAAQVREPLKRSTARADRYGDLIHSLRHALRPQS